MEDIKILEEYLEPRLKNLYNCEFGYEVIRGKELKAIENLLKRYKEQEETISRLFRIIEASIPISVIQNKIDEYREKRNKLADGHFWDNERNINEDTSLFIAIETLKLLLKERNT